jgi:prolyl 4-hydroxylase
VIECVLEKTGPTERNATMTLLADGYGSSTKIRQRWLVWCLAILCPFPTPSRIAWAESASLWNHNDGPPLAFAGGFGASGSSGNKRKKDLAKPRQKVGFSKDLAPPAPSPPKKNLAANGAPKLDKWGLPEISLDSIFPPMPSGTELIASESDKEYSLSDIQKCLNDYIDLRLDDFFDDHGVEKNAHGGSPMKVHLLHQSPPVLAIDNFLTSEDCTQVKDIALREDSGAFQVNSVTFPGALSTRTSTSWFCYYSQVPTLLAKSHYALNIPYETMEEPQIVRYKTGQEFSWHYDEVPPSELKNGGQRLATLLVYLADVPSGGGGTIFRDLKSPNGDQLAMQPSRGSALLFFPASGDGRPDDRTLHKGEVIVGEDEKWIVQMWIHQKPYQAVLPKGNFQESARTAIDRVAATLRYT